ncbi:MAG: O-antigen ligase family protein, partial [bacterium]|nr:O-antigen ligase family protein [bacterium]
DETRAVAVGDLNDDGHIDWATGNINQANTLYFGDGEGGVLKTINFGQPDGATYAIAIADMNNETNRDRIYMYKTGINIFKDYPFTGVGAANVGKIYDKYKPAEAKLSNPHLHNNFFQELAVRGIFSLISLTAAFISIFILLIQKIKNSVNFEKTIATGALFAFIGFFVAGLFEYNFGDTEMKFFLFYFLSIPFALISGQQTPSNTGKEGELNDETETSR